MPFQRYPLVKLQKGGLEAVGEGPVQPVHAGSLPGPMSALPGKRYATVSVARSIIVAVKRIPDLPNVLLGNGNGELPIYMCAKRSADGRFGEPPQRP